MISAVMGSNSLIEGVNNVKEAAKSYYEELFREGCRNKRVPDNLNFRSLCQQDRRWLDRRFSEEEAKDAVWTCDGNKVRCQTVFPVSSLSISGSLLKKTCSNL